MKQEKYGFVYLWFDRKHKRYYVGCHWGTVDDGYICSSSWMKKAYKIRPHDFKKRILKTNISHRPDMYIEEQRYLDMIKSEEIKNRYYNLNIKNGNVWHKWDESIKTIGQKISASKTGKNLGKPCPEHVKKAISNANKSRVFTEEHKAKLRAAKLGRKLSPEHREKVIKTLKYVKDK